MGHQEVTILDPIYHIVSKQVSVRSLDLCKRTYWMKEELNNLTL